MHDNTRDAIRYLAIAAVAITFFYVSCGNVRAHHAALVPVFEAEVARAGVTAWVPQLAAQIQVESAWRPEARSRFAAGLAQFTPPTWSDIAPLTAPSCAGQLETNPACSIRAQIVYMRRLLHRYRMTRERWPFAWAAYNGGPGWIGREQSRCRRQPGCAPTRWYGHVERYCLRARWACTENRAYPRKIERAMPRFDTKGSE